MENQSSDDTPRKIIQLSDLHFKKSRIHDQKIIIKSLCSDIKKQSEKHGYPDIIIFSGDIVHDADESEVYNLFFDNVLVPILETSKLDLDSVFLVPGNHDIHRSHVKNSEKTYNKILSEFNNRDSLNDIYRSEGIHEFAYDRSRAFLNFVNKFQIIILEIIRFLV